MCWCRWQRRFPLESAGSRATVSPDGLNTSELWSSPLDFPLTPVRRGSLRRGHDPGVDDDAAFLPATAAWSLPYTSLLHRPLWRADEGAADSITCTGCLTGAILLRRRETRITETAKSPTGRPPAQHFLLRAFATPLLRYDARGLRCMDRAGRGRRLPRRLVFVFATSCVVLLASASAQGQLRPSPTALADAPTELLDRLRADPFTYFRFVNRQWAARVCEAFGDVSDLPIVRLHGDAHVEQFAFTNDSWGLGDFDDSARGPEFIDIVRFLGSINLATRQRGWRSDRDALWDRFLAGYRAGLSNPTFRPPEPDIVRVLRAATPLTRAAFLAWGESQMQPMGEAAAKSVVAGMEAFERVVRPERPDLRAGYFAVKHAGWLRMGVGSATTRKVLIRVQGPTDDDDDDELLEAKEGANLEGVACLEDPTTPPALRIVDGTRQLSRLKHDIVAVGPTQLIPAAADRAAARAAVVDRELGGILSRDSAQGLPLRRRSRRDRLRFGRTARCGRPE